MKNRSMFVSLVTIVVAMYIGMWIFVGVTPGKYFADPARDQIGKTCYITVVPEVAAGPSFPESGIFRGQNEHWMFVEDKDSKELHWIPLGHIRLVRFGKE